MIRLPPDRQWGILTMDKYPYIAFLNMEDGVTKRKIIIRRNLDVEIYLKEKVCPYIQVERLKNVDNVNQVLFSVFSYILKHFALSRFLTLIFEFLHTNFIA